MATAKKTSNYIPKTPKHIECNIEKTLEVLGGKWAFLITFFVKIAATATSLSMQISLQVNVQ